MTNKEFESVLKVEKFFKTNFKFPTINTSGKYELLDANKNKYIFDYQLGSNGKFYIELSMDKAKQKWQIREDNLPLIRIDVNGPPHLCQDGKSLKNHIHVYYPEKQITYSIENFHEKLYKSTKPYDILCDFFKHVNIKLDHLKIQEGF